jgi:excisionase family DNA binding protein
MKLISIKELSQFLNVKQSTLYAWVHNGTIPFYKLNGLIRFDLEDIQDWVRNSKPDSQNAKFSIRKSKSLDIDNIVKKAVEDVTNKRYNPSKRETSLNQAQRKEV